MGILMWPSLSSATSVVEVSVEDALENAQFVFEGRALIVQETTKPGRRYPQTCVRFEVLEVLKGNATGDVVDLCFLGGRQGTRRMIVGEMQYPELGEKCIYFVENPLREQVNPLYGWSQGHFLVERDGASATERVRTADRRPVREVRTGVRRSAEGLSNGTARGVVAGNRGEMREAMSKKDFKERLRSIMRERRQ